MNKIGTLQFLWDGTSSCDLGGKMTFENLFNCEVTPSRQGVGVFDIDSDEPSFADVTNLDVQDADPDGNNFIFKIRKMTDYKLRVEVRDYAGLVTDLCNIFYVEVAVTTVFNNMPFIFIGDQSIGYIAPTYMYFNGVKQAGTGDIIIEKSTDDGMNYDSVDYDEPFSMNEDDILRMTSSNTVGNDFKTITLY